MSTCQAIPSGLALGSFQCISVVCSFSCLTRGSQQQNLARFFQVADAFLGGGLGASGEDRQQMEALLEAACEGGGAAWKALLADVAERLLWATLEAGDGWTSKGVDEEVLRLALKSHADPNAQRGGEGRLPLDEALERQELMITERSKWATESLSRAGTCTAPAPHQHGTNTAPVRHQHNRK